MQFIIFMQMLGWIILITGVLIICLAFMRLSSSSDKEGYQTKVENKGIILLGPIPIVWGYGRIGWIIAAIVGVSLFLVFLLIFN